MLLKALDAIDALNQHDPNITRLDDGTSVAKEWVYGKRMSAWLAKYEPNASELLQIAIRGQHICRWKITRDSYPMDKAGYKKWRTELAKFHAETLSTLMLSIGYNELDCEHVRNLVLKRSLKSNAETQALEDVACLVFLEFYFDDFASKYDDAKIVDILQKTWNKMSPKGHQLALTIQHSNKASALIQRALT